MSPQILQILINIQIALKRDLDVIGTLVEQKKEEYIKVTAMIMHMESEIDMLNMDKIVINCDPEKGE